MYVNLLVVRDPDDFREVRVEVHSEDDQVVVMERILIDGVLVDVVVDRINHESGYRVRREASPRDRGSFRQTLVRLCLGGGNAAIRGSRRKESRLRSVAINANNLVTSERIVQKSRG